MHRHGYQGRKFGRERDQRSALLRSLAESLILREKIETTLHKAKEVAPYVEKLITKAKKADLHSKRQVFSALQTREAATKLIDNLAPKMSSRNSGHLSIQRSRVRRGDNAQLATISFIVDEAAPKTDTKVPAAKKQTVAKVASTNRATKKESVT